MRDRLGVVVGYEKSSSAARALMWGAAEAVARGLPLTVCRVWEWPYHEWPGELVPLDLARRPAQRLVKDAAARVAKDHPRLAVNTLTDRGAPEVVLADLSEDAELVVVGSRGHGALAGLVAGSVSGHVAALRFAVTEARRLDAPLRALIARPPHGGETGVQVQVTAWEELALWQRRFPERQADVEYADEPARPALLEAARKAALLVVGARGLGEVRGLPLGSVSQAVVHGAACPVAVVHGRISTYGLRPGP